MEVPTEAKAVRFTQPVRCGPEKSQLRDTWQASDSVRILVERGQVVLAVQAEVDGKSIVHVKGFPLGTRVLEIDYGSHAAEDLEGVDGNAEPAPMPTSAGEAPVSEASAPGSAEPAPAINPPTVEGSTTTPKPPSRKRNGSRAPKTS